MPIEHFSRIISGVMTWGEWGKNLNTKEVAQLISHTVDQGITTIDHADIYGNYTTEALFGGGFKASSLNRNAIQIITKCGIQHLCPNRDNKVKHYNYSKDYIIWSAEKSLKNLQTDYIDLLLLHRPSPLMNPAEIAEAVQKLLKDGKILHVGVSNFTPPQTQKTYPDCRQSSRMFHYPYPTYVRRQPRPHDIKQHCPHVLVFLGQCV